MHCQRFLRPHFFAILLIVFTFQTAIYAQTSVFTYQGRLNDTSMPATGTYDFEFALYDAGGTIIGTPTQRNGIAVTNGVFTVQLDFGEAAFPGADRFLEIRVKRQTDPNYTPLTPRQQITSSPHAIRSAKATNADNATNAQNAVNATNATNAVNATNATNATTAGSATNFTGNLAGDVTGTQSATVVSSVGGQSAANVAAAAASTGTATSANTPNTIVKRDASGNFSAGTINAATEFNISGFRILSSAGTNNLFAGVGAGKPNSTGGFNAFVGTSAGSNNATGSGNSFVGANAGKANTMGEQNAFFGADAGLSNTTGGSNAFFGTQAGQANTTGANNTIIGRGANVGSGALTFATAIGAGAVVSSSNRIVLGKVNERVQLPGITVDNTLTQHLCRNTTTGEIFGCSTIGPARPAENGLTETQQTQIEAQQAQIDAQAKQLAEQKALIDGLRKLLCASNPTADVCRLP